MQQMLPAGIELVNTLILDQLSTMLNVTKLYTVDI